ncbi:MAG: F0F1 ATP synthase subunit B [Pseudomonadota bacterium]
MSINITLIGQMITFALLVWFTMKYIWPPLMQALEERRKKIAEGLAAAEHGHKEMELAEKRAMGLLKEAKDQAADIVNLAQKRANEIVEESKDSGREEGERLLTAAKAEINQELEQAKEGLRQEVSALALKAAGQILKSEVDEAKHKDIVKDISKQLGS